MDPRLIDERDTQWESSERPFRIEIINQNVHSSYDVEHTQLADVISWARSQLTGDGTYSIGIRTLNDRGGLGIEWIIENAKG